MQLIIEKYQKSILRRAKNILTKATHRIEQRPLQTVFVTLGVLLMLIFVSNLLSKPAEKTETQNTHAKKVEVYTIGTAPKVSVLATVEKSGVITISALTGGIVSQINVREGSTVYNGTNLLWISSNYTGASVASQQRKLAEAQYTHAQETYGLQKDIITKQRDIANKQESNAYELREITKKSIDETKSLISLNEEIVTTLDNTINSSTATETEIQTAKQTKAQVLAGLNQVRSVLRSAEYQINVDNPPAELSQTQRDLALKQLDFQERSLELQKELSRIQLTIARIAESLHHPVSPSKGTVQRIHVKLGQQVAPGTPLITIAADESVTTARAFVPQSYAQAISATETSTLYISNKSLEVIPQFVSEEAVQGSLYMIKYLIPSDESGGLSDGNIIRLSLPVGPVESFTSMPFVPLDAVYQTADSTYVFVVQNHKAQAKTISPGIVYGRFVRVESGLDAGDEIITDRNVISGEAVQTN